MATGGPVAIALGLLPQNLERTQQMTFLRSYHRPAFKLRLIAGEVPEWLLKHKRRRYIFAAVLSFPLWAPRAELKAIDEECRRRTKVTGIPHQVDHIIPINHPLVCGLTVPWNLQIITGRDNGRKGNAWDEENEGEQLELFAKAFVEQFELNL